MRKVAVGTDGSKNAGAALRWAAEYARGHGATLKVIHVWSYPYPTSEAMEYAAFTPDSFEEAAMATLNAALAEVDTTGLVVEKVTREGHEATELLDAASDADVLVVGARGHGGFAGLLLGSVASQCTRHPKIPTVVIPTAA